jgi:hypothetical protein
MHNGMEGDNSRSQLGMLIVRRIICVLSWGFVFPRAFTEGAVEPLSTTTSPADTAKAPR